MLWTWCNKDSGSEPSHNQNRIKAQQWIKTKSHFSMLLHVSYSAPSKKQDPMRVAIKNYS